MRYARLRFAPVEGQAFHPLGEALSTEPTIERGDITRVDLLEDGSAILLAEARGDVERYREILRESPHVYEFSVVESDGWWYSYTHYEPNGVNREMLSVRYELPVTMEMPIEVEPDGAMVVTLVGSQEAFVRAQQRRLDSDAYDVELLETGPYRPDLDDLYLSLTDRQREVLDAAVELGYYEAPRDVTHEAVAEAVGLSPSTVGEHLQKIEAHVFGELVD